jgi:endoglucanase
MVLPQALTLKWVLTEFAIATVISGGVITTLNLTHTDFRPALVAYEQSALGIVNGRPSETPTTQPTVTGSPLPTLTTQKLASPPSNAKAQVQVPLPPSAFSDAAVIAKIRATPQGLWATGGNPVTAVNSAIASGPLASLILYDIPGRDCGNYSSGGAISDAAYLAYVSELAAAISGRAIRIVLEPDALALGCTNTSLFADTADHTGTVTLLKRAGAQVYIDAGHSGWPSLSAITDKLLAANIENADGFSLNVSNFDSTTAEVAWGNQISRLVGGKHFIVDTSRNGIGSNGEWCNPSGRALGISPILQTGNRLVDAYLWMKRPGESDGTCNGGPAAGQWWQSYALALGRAAGW